MKKSKKLLSVLLAVLMILSSVSVMATAYGDYKNLGPEVYDSIDAPRGALLSVEQRASYIADMIDDLLAGAGIGKGNYVVAKYDFTSLNGVIDTFNQTLFSVLKAALGDLSNMNEGAIRKTLSSRQKDGDTKILMQLMQFVSDNKELFANVLSKGSLNLGSIVGGMVNLSSVNNILKDLPSFLGEMIYGLGARQLTNGIGDDPVWRNSTPWAELEVKPSFEEMIKNIILKLLTEPRHTTNITSPEQNTLGNQALKEVNGDVTYYYCYGVKADGSLILEGDEADKVYLSHWDENSALLSDFPDDIIDFAGKSVYDLLESVLPWAFDTFAAHNLDAQLRATLMQAAGAVNVWESDPEIQEQLKSKIDEYKAVQDEGDVWTLSEKFKAEEGAAGDYNFMYFSLSNQNINSMPEDLYYVVEWGGSYEYYHVDFSGVNPFFKLGDWEYQIGKWEEVCKDHESGKSVLKHLNNILGNIVTAAVPSAEWTTGDNSNLINNIVKIVKQFIKEYPDLVFADGQLPDNFDNMNAEEGVVLAGRMLMDSLLKAIILPENVTSVEELIVYGLREYTDNVLQEYGAEWDAKIAEAAKLNGTQKEDAFLDIALNMAASLGAYYLKDIIGYGTYATGDRATAVKVEFKDVKIGPSYDWKVILGDIIDWVIDLWVPNLSSNIRSKYPDAFSGNDGLAKLSALFSALFPSTAKIIGCDSTTYALDLEVVYTKLRSALNGDFTPVLTALERKDSGTTANYSIAKAIVTILKELFGNLGFDSANSWTATFKANNQTFIGLSNFLDNAANSDMPITALIGKYGERNSLANLAGAFLGCLGETRSIWLADALAVVLQFIYMGDLTYKGTWYEGKDAYTGAESFKVDFTVGLDTNGLPEAWASKGYREGPTTIDGNYSVTVTRVAILDNGGSVIPGSTKEFNQVLQPNTKAEFSTELNGVASDVTTDTVVVYYKVQTPSGSFMNDGEELELRKTIIVTSEKNDALTPTQTVFSGTKQSKGGAFNSRSNTLTYNITYGSTNTYISDIESLKTAESTMFVVTDVSSETGNDVGGHTTTKVYTNGYGWNVLDEDTGKISVRQAEDASGDFTDLTKYFTVTKDGDQLNKDQLQDLWFKWNLNDGNTGLNKDGGANETREGQLWVVDTSSLRSDFEEDFTTYKIDVNTILQYNYRTWNAVSSAQQGTQDNNISFTTYINLYNSYDLDAVLGAALDAAYTREQFRSGSAADAAWNAYQEALSYAMNQRYGKWVGATFEADHTDGNGVSTFKIASEKLQEAKDELLKYFIEVEAAEVVIIEPSNPDSELNFAYTALQEQYDKGYRDINFMLYRWNLYKDARNFISNVLDAATPPSGVANNYLVGVDLDNDGIDAVVRAIKDARISELVAGLVVKATEEEKQAAAEARLNFVMPDYDVQQVADQVDAMKTYEERLIAKYSDAELADLHHYLHDSIEKYGNESAADYTEASFAAYKAALDHAKEVDANKTAQPSVLHAARYDFQVAYKELVKTDEAVDLTALKEAMEKARDILTNPDNYKLSEKASENGFEEMDEALQDLILKAGYISEYEGEKYFIGGEYTGEYALTQEGLLTGKNKENWVAEIVERVNAAVENFALNSVDPEIFPKEEGEGTGTGFVDTKNNDGTHLGGYLYGVEAGQTVEEVFGASTSLKIRPNDAGYTNGTGAIVELLDADGRVHAEYVLIIFGDLNGDGVVDTTDRFYLSQNIGGNSDLTAPQNFAGNLNADEVTDTTDRFYLTQALSGNTPITINPFVD